MLSEADIANGIGLCIMESVDELQRDYVFKVETKKEGDFVHMIIECPTTNFAMAYYQLGRLSAKKMIDDGTFRERK